MKKQLTILLVTVGILSTIFAGCRKEGTSTQPPAAPENSIDTESNINTEMGIDENASGEVQADSFSFAEITSLQFIFASRAGGWRTTLKVAEDGSFSGEFSDSELGVTGENYPNGTVYRCNFNGQFSMPQKVNEYTYFMKVVELESEKRETVIEDGVMYSYLDTPYGIEKDDEVLLYLQGAPIAELPEEFLSWIGYYDISTSQDTVLPFVALNSGTEEYGFYSYNIVDRVRESIAAAEESADVLETSIQEDTLTQSELNEKAKELYDVWDNTLNQLWDVLKNTLEEDEMQILLAEQREWIMKKEQTVDEAGSEFEGGSMLPMIKNHKAAEITKERVYELLELLEAEK